LIPRSCVMPLAAWVLLATFTWCSYAHTAHAAPVPPVAAALSSPSQGFGSNNNEDDSVAQPEKRLLKYFLPGSQAWMDDGGDLYPISQEGSKRAYSDRNFLRFGRSDVNKRNRNFLRFGRSGLGDYDNSDDETLNDSLVKRSRNFLRFGRSVNRQLNALSCDGCDEHNYPGTNPISPPIPVQSMVPAKQDIAHTIESPEPDDSTSQRMKRAAVPTANDYGSMSSYSPIVWARGFQPEEEIITVSSEDPQDVNKRALDRNFLRFGRDGNFLRFGRNRNFLRFGRNRNFLRFGKRDRSNEYPPSESSESSESLVAVSPAEYSRNVRAPQRNFLRFG
ncbi:FMRFamide-related neuropeptides-like, partial [Procambarus clarkii]|uniref:FMRFamide-related neuropeptides-like n=1 Tax=Procambarus clarkii TaxID=6728 RepID=UPI0037437A8D